MRDDIKRKRIRKYFSKSLLGLNITILILGLLVVFISVSYGRWGQEAILLGGLFASIGLLAVIVSIVGRLNRPTDGEIDSWLADDLEEIVKRSLNKLGLSSDQIRGKELRIISPIYWTTSGVNSRDVRYKKGKDRLVRFSIYRITIIQLAEQLLASYACDFNFLKNVKLNEETNEFHYIDIASVSTSEISSSYKLPNGKSLVHAQVFRLAAVNGEKIEVTIGASKLQENIDGILPETGAEKAVQVIRVMLRDKKYRGN